MKKILLLFVLVLTSSFVLGINSGTSLRVIDVANVNEVGGLLLSEWSLGSVDLGFLLVIVFSSVLFVRFGLPMSVVGVMLMGFSSIFAIGFNSLFAWGFLLIGVVALSLFVAVRLLTQSNY